MSYRELKDKDFNLFKKYAYDNCGIFLHEGKKELVSARIGKRMRKIGINSYSVYYKLLINDDSGNETVEFINAISTNHTSFFRGTNHFEYITDEIIPEFKKNNYGSKLTIWSAACSTGEEPYSLAICINEGIDLNPSIKFKILATDISTKVLSTASAGIYSEDKVIDIPEHLLRKYFQKGFNKYEGYYKVKKILRDCIEFKRFNLLDTYTHNEKINCIFCRNVMIYFDKNVQTIIVNKFYDCLNDGGYLFVGHSESLMSIDHKFKYIRPTIYLK